ncbi:RodZ domain-containing protein [Vreelandella salicampi]|uniref:Helix-turn-helix domain-containing protein n=1 Tax=Vreelandella salicampi TaxID=1449798 RepID=A0A7Z0RU44_9GAMM|nr:RodZ domain-containing protein [Halomonas salicampi]NYS60172.1 helix-turn-helix domain-containing protein [Halomonas salicampi]
MSDTYTKELHDEPRTPSPGEQLKSQREQLGLSLQEAADALHLRPAVIDGLERGNYDEIPIATYRRGYLRAYARYLGIDESPVLEAYKERHGSLEAERTITPVSASKPPSRMGALLFKLVTLLIIAGLITVTVMWWQSRGGSAPPGIEEPTQNDALSEMTTPESAVQNSSFQENGSTGQGQGTTGQESAVEESTALEDTALESTVPESTVPESTLAESTAAGVSEPTATETPGNAASLNQNESVEPALEEPQASDEEVLAEDSADDASAGNVPNTLELTFNQQSWTEIFDANNQRVLVGLQEPGTSASVEGEPPFRLTVGNATGVELRYQGDIVDLEERAGANNVARFTLGE